VAAEPSVQNSAAANQAERAAISEAEGDHVVAYYFHTNRRCMTCRTIEAYTEEALKERFSEELESGKLKFRSLDVSVAENAHFVDDYQLFSQSVVLSYVRNGEEKRWNNLARVWQLVRDKPAFFSYIQEETKAFMEDSND
jgi:hypothetical protein